MLYLLDANVVITAKDSYYAIDQVPQFWDWLVHQAEEGLVKMPLETLDEVSAGNDKDEPFYKWRKDKANHGPLLLDEEADPVAVQQVLNEGYGENLTDDELITIGADPFLVAYAIGHDDRTAVTTEVSAPGRQRQNRKLPDVCDQFSVPRINTFQMTRQLNWSTNWKP